MNKHTKRFIKELLQDCQERCHQFDVATAAFADDEEIEMLNRLKHKIKNSFTENYLTNAVRLMRGVQ